MNTSKRNSEPNLLEKFKLWLGLGKELCILGREGAGKTTLYTKLCNRFNVPENEQTFEDEVPSFVIRLDNDKKVIVRKGIDRPGAVEHLDSYFERAITDNDIIFFIVDGFRYLNEEDYTGYINSCFFRLHQMADNPSKHVRIILSQANKFKSKNDVSEAYETIRQILLEKNYGRFVLKNIIRPLDLTQDKDVDTIISSLFDKIKKNTISNNDDI